MFLNCTSTWDFNVNTAFLLYVKWMMWFKKILQAKLQSTTRNGLVYRRIFFISNVQNRYKVSRFISKVYRWQLTPPRFINLKRQVIQNQNHLSEFWPLFFFNLLFADTKLKLLWGHKKYFIFKTRWVPLDIRRTRNVL